MKNNYDNIAVLYDSLSRLVFGRAQVYVQEALLRHISPQSHILIVGGGSGWILDKLSELHPQGLKITYVEISQKMLARSKKRNIRANDVRFVHVGIEDFESDACYDVVMTAFLFDNFAIDRAEFVFQKLHGLLRPSGSWLFADFVVSPSKKDLWKKLMLNVMYSFFKLICDVEASKLVNMQTYFDDHYYQVKASYRRYADFIKGIVYQKRPK